MKRDFVECRHPSLPGQTALLTAPRNGWKPVKHKTSRQDRPVETDSPVAGESTTTDSERNLS